MKKQKENSIQSDILDFLRGNKKKGIKGIGGWWLNFHGGDPFMPRGLPDIIGCLNGRFIALEAKRPGEDSVTKRGVLDAIPYKADIERMVSYGK